MNNILNIEHAFYINLASRTDRRIQAEEQLKSVGIHAQRFNAIESEDGRIGCSMSHLQCLQTARENNWDHVLICEDDIEFLDPELFKTQLNKFLQKHHSWDVILFAGDNFSPYKKIDNTCIRVSRCQTTTGYLVKKHYYNKLINNIAEGVHKLQAGPYDPFYFAIDRYWIQLQKADHWYLIIPLSVVQRKGYSDIEKKIVNRETRMKDIKINTQRSLAKKIIRYIYNKIK